MHSLSQSQSVQGPEYVLLGLPQSFGSDSTHEKNILMFKNIVENLKKI
jgi:hypothetical protein